MHRAYDELARSATSSLKESFRDGGAHLTVFLCPENPSAGVGKVPLRVRKTPGFGRSASTPARDPIGLNPPLPKSFGRATKNNSVYSLLAGNFLPNKRVVRIKKEIIGEAGSIHKWVRDQF